MNLKKKFLRDYYDYAKYKLFPICRSLTGDGNKKTLNLIKKKIKFLKIKSFQSGSKVYDWRIPPEWNIKSASIKDKFGKKLVDFSDNNLHLVGYSIPIKKKVNKGLLLSKLYTFPNNKNAIPYVTSYYKKDWGFCVTEIKKNLIKKLYKKDDLFKVHIQSSFKKNGKLHYGEALVPGKSKKEILISTYICHPSMANNEISGILVSMCLLKHFEKKKLKHTLRFIFIPENIGSQAYISKNLKRLKKNVVGGFVLSCIGDNRNHSCMLSKNKNSPSDNALLETYKKLKLKFKIHPFTRSGSDERRFNYPGIDIPIASIFRTKYGEYPEYHSSFDNFDLVTLEGIKGGFKVAKNAIKHLDRKIIPKNCLPCEPQLGKRNLYPTISKNSLQPRYKNYLNFLLYADGRTDLGQIKKILNISNSECLQIYKILKKNNLIT